jgi:hypothetical protein
MKREEEGEGRKGGDDETHIVNSSSHSGVDVFFLTSVRILPFCPSTTTSQYGLARTAGEKGLMVNGNTACTVYTSIQNSLYAICCWVFLPLSVVGLTLAHCHAPLCG